MFSDCDWIWGGEGKPDEYVDYRLEFSVASGRQYILYLSCDTDYALYAGDRLLAFGQYSDYPAYKVYDTIDLSMLPAGETVLTLTVWYQGVDTQTYIKKPAGVLFRLTEDGRLLLTSGEQIPSRATPGYVPYGCKSITSQLGLSFTYDASYPEECYTPSHRVEGLPQRLFPRPVEKLDLQPPFCSQIVQSGGYILTDGENPARLMRNARLATRTDYAVLDGEAEVTLSALEEEDGIYAILDMGRETAGFLNLDFNVDYPCHVIIGWGEHLVDGRVRAAIGNRDFTCEYYAVAGRNQFLHPFRRLGCRYLQIFVKAKKIILRRVSICETAYPLTIKPLGKGNLLQSRIYDVCVNTLRQCMHEHYEDCPWREQALYTMDSRNQMLCGYYVFGETRFARACLNLITYGMREDELLSLCYPAGRGRSIPAFSLIFLIQMREYLEYSGDYAFLEEKYPFLQKLIATFSNRVEENGLIPIFTADRQWNFYEWSPGLDGKCTCKFQTPLNAFYSLALQNMAQIAERLNKQDDAASYRQTARQVNASISACFYHSHSGLFCSFGETWSPDVEYSVLTNSLCLLCGAASQVGKETIYKILTANGPADTGYRVVPNTLSMNTFRYDALLAEDASRFKAGILDEIDRTYLSMLEHGATTFWETVQGAADFNGAGSLCHGWSALPAYYYHILLP